MDAEDKPRWGVVSTQRGSAADILRFAAHHLDLGADRLYLHLDEPNSAAHSALIQHPKVAVWLCDAEFWAERRSNRPERHQLRQSANATHIYRNTDLDWLCHIDVDEFLWPSRPIPELLSAVPAELPAVRVRPIEALAGGNDLYKAFIPSSPDRQALVETIYPNFGAFLTCGFLSHVQGKLFVRTGLPGVNDRIHNIFQNNQLLPCKTELPEVELCHRHAPDWDHWLAHYRYRLKHGSYKPGMTPNVTRERGGLNKHELLSWIEAEEGEIGLRAFFDEMSGADPDTHARLEEFGMIRHRPLNLDVKVAKHFPGTA